MFIELLERFNSNRVTVNYDIGNSAALGYDLVEELDYYGKRITDIHLKDRVLGGGPVELGKGDADIYAFFNILKEFDYLLFGVREMLARWTPVGVFEDLSSCAFSSSLTLTNFWI